MVSAQTEGDERILLKANQETGSSGFTLLETLTALTILAVALVALFQAHISGIRTTETAQSYGHARILAESVMAESLTKLQNGQLRALSGQSGQFRWRVNVAKSNEAWAKPKRPVLWRLHTVRVTVSWGRGRELELSTLKLLSS